MLLCHLILCYTVHMATTQFWTILGAMIALFAISITITITLFLRLDAKIDSVETNLRQEIRDQTTRIDHQTERMDKQSEKMDQLVLAVGELRSDVGELRGDIRVIQNRLNLSQTA